MEDPRTKGLLLTDSVLYPIGIICIYLLVVQIIGPWIVKKFRRINCETFMGYYNVGMFATNMQLGLVLTWYSYRAGYSMVCQPVNSKNKHLETQIARWMWGYYIVKIMELQDTVFMILKKKQVPTIFIYHHATMVLIAWIGVKFIPGGSTIGFAALNTWVHVALYIHYKMTEYNIRMRHAITVIAGIQIIQFVVIMIWCLVVMFANCGYPKTACLVLFLYMSSFIYFFVPNLLQKIFGQF